MLRRCNRYPAVNTTSPCGTGPNSDSVADTAPVCWNCCEIRSNPFPSHKCKPFGCLSARSCAAASVRKKRLKTRKKTDSVTSALPRALSRQALGLSQSSSRISRLAVILDVVLKVLPHRQERARTHNLKGIENDQ